MTTKEVLVCPICRCVITEQQEDASGLSECMACGSEWVTDTGEVTLNGKEL
jgi:Zn-finger nucleic acid-binding protein